jgi:hypothetical protein
MYRIKTVMKQVGACMPLILNFRLGYAIWSVHVHMDGLKLNGTHQVLVEADDVNIMGGSVYTVKERNIQSLVVGNNETGLEVNADKPKNMDLS